MRKKERRKETVKSLPSKFDKKIQRGSQKKNQSSIKKKKRLTVYFSLATWILIIVNIFNY